MPKRDAYDSDGGFVEDAPKSKKPKATKISQQLMDEDGNPYWEISKLRRVQISEFKNNTMVNIREFYEKDGKSLPGKKGISMTIEQYSHLLELLPQIEAALKDKGIVVPRPSFDGAPANIAAAGEDDEDEDELPARPKSNAKKIKKNHEPTDDEDEDDEE